MLQGDAGADASEGQSDSIDDKNSHPRGPLVDIRGKLSSGSVWAAHESVPRTRSMPSFVKTALAERPAVLIISYRSPLRKRD